MLEVSRGRRQHGLGCPLRHTRVRRGDVGFRLYTSRESRHFPCRLRNFPWNRHDVCPKRRFALMQLFADMRLLNRLNEEVADIGAVAAEYSSRGYSQCNNR